MMQYGKVPGIDKPISRIVQGCVMLTTKKADYSRQILDAVFELGINTFDHAHVYGGGDCERLFGQWVRDRGIRDQVVLLTKGAHHNADRQRVTPWDITADIYDSLARTGFDYIDLYVLHRDDPSLPVGPIVEVLNKHQEAGLIKAFGASNWRHERIAAANEYAAKHGLTPFAVSSPQFSLGEMLQSPWPNCISISGPAERQARDWYAQSDLKLFTWSSLANGFWSGKFDRAALEARAKDDPEIVVRCFRNEANLNRLDRLWQLARERGLTVAQVATAWLMNHPLNVHALIAAYSKEEAQANVNALDVQLTAKEMAWVNLED